MTNQRNQYTREFKLEAINMVIEHKRKITEVAASLGIGDSTLDKWLRQYREELNGEAPKASALSVHYG
ncbi:transposase [Psychrobacter frigidicola]|uniref:transposase n=1 Tax=Psychrobacter frigidicola TaxID=45611 RepID=UPI001918F2B5|nr:transposase [Psychrobacter frigidicola]